MKIRVKATGHIEGWEYTGWVIQWSLTSEQYGDVWLQVPCVILSNDDGLHVVPLKKHQMTIEIEDVTGLV